MKLGFEELTRHICFMHINRTTSIKMKYIFVACNAENINATVKIQNLKFIPTKK